MKILITGAAGFIGSHVSERLAELKYEVIGLDNFSDYYPKELKLLNMEACQNKSVYFLNGDLRKTMDYRRLPKDFDYIFHFAAHPGISDSSSFDDYLSNNIIATQFLADFATACVKLKLFINISTSSVYGRNASKDEESPVAPISQYGITKLAAEQIVLSYSRNKIYKSCSLRLYSVYGPRERPDKLYSKVIDCANTNVDFPIYEGSLNHSRSFTYVGDIVEGIIAVIGREDLVDGEIINLGSDQEHTTREGIEVVQELLDVKIKFEAMPARNGDQLKTKAVIKKAQQLLNYSPNTSLRNGLKQQIKWYNQINKK